MHGTQLASGIGTVLVILVLGPLGALEPLETWWFDRLFELRGSRAPTTPIVIVTIDESSITEINRQWPFPRARHADLIDRISAGHPLAIGVDLLFDGPSAWGARDDEALGAAIMRAGTVVLSAAKTTDVQMLDGQVAIERTFSRVPLPVIRRGAAAVAHTKIPVESDASACQASTHCARDRDPDQFSRRPTDVSVGAVLPCATRRRRIGGLFWKDRAHRSNEPTSARPVSNCLRRKR
jgi:CHASE2 domain-containing sensor protein